MTSARSSRHARRCRRSSKAFIDLTILRALQPVDFPGDLLQRPGAQRQERGDLSWAIPGGVPADLGCREPDPF